MVVKRQCSFCAQEIEPGTGMMFVKRDGTVFHFCTSSCRKQQLHLHRVGHRFKWTRAHELKRAADRSSAQKAPTAAPSQKAGRTRSGARRPVAPPVAPAAEPSPAPAPSVEPVATEAAPSTEPPTPSPAPAAKPRRPRKKAETAAKE
jgi:large subunit ribosomal protein L24e